MNEKIKEIIERIRPLRRELIYVLHALDDTNAEAADELAEILKQLEGFEEKHTK